MAFTSQESRKVRANFSFEAGALIRRQVMAEIKRIAFQNDVEVSVDETKFLLYSSFNVSLEGCANRIQQTQQDLNNRFNRV